MTGKANSKGWTAAARAKARLDGRRGGLVGGPARAAKLTAKRRRAIALIAVRAREARKG